MKKAGILRASTESYWRGLAETYGEELDAIGDALVRAKIVTRKAVQRDGVRFAVLNAVCPKRKKWLASAKAKDA